jgi:C4-dicarboxylate-specific signal transduction histidine kinase
VSDTVRVLLVEDNPGDARLIRELLRYEPGWELVWASDLRTCFRHLAEGGFEAVLLDLGLPDSQGLPTVAAVHENSPGVPIVVLTGHDDESVSLKAVEAGAQDYLVKGTVDAALVTRTVRYARDRMRAAQELLASRERLRKLNQELQATTTQLIQTTKLTALGELAAGLVHELNQPLNGIGIITQAALRYMDGYSKQELQDQLREVLVLVGSMKSIIDHMRLFVRPSTAAEARELDVNATLERALLLVERQMVDEGVAVQRHFDSGLPLIWGDPIRLEQVFLNLLMNARSALHASPRFPKRLVLRTCLAELSPGVEAVEVEVRDSGTGIPAAMLDRVFQPFFTTKEAGKGTGLGLSISKKIVEEHRGRIEVESTEGEGTIFRVTLPTQPAPPITQSGVPLSRR